MKTKFLIMLTMAFCLINANAQNVTYTSGPDVSSDISVNYSLIGVYKGHLYYHRNGYVKDNFRFYLVKLEIKTLTVVEEFELSKTGHVGMWEDKVFKEGKLVLFFMESIKNGDEEDFVYEGFVFDLEKLFSEYRQVKFDAVTQSRSPSWHEYGNNEGIVFVTDEEVKYYDMSLNQIDEDPSPSTEEKVFMPKDLRPKGFGRSGFGSEVTKNFYPIPHPSNLFIRSEFKPDNNCYGDKWASGNGKFTAISLEYYDYTTGTSKNIYKVNISEERYLINFDCFGMNDKSVVIIGAYQEGSIQSKKCKLGMFTVIIDSNFNEVSPIRYSNPEEFSRADLLKGYENNRYAFRNHWITYRYMNLLSENDYLFYCEYKSIDNQREFDVIKVDRKTGEIEFDKLLNRIASIDFKGFNKFSFYELSDTSGILLFNDHFSNQGKSANHPKLKVNEYDPKTSNLTCIYYSSNYGFMSRKPVVEGSEDGFLFYNNILDSYKFKNEDGSTSIILLANSSNSRKHKFYKVTFSN